MADDVTPDAEDLIARHLGPLEPMPPRRRIRLGWFASQWLARGMTVAALCEELGIVRQTGYRWMDELTHLFGDQLHDPYGRIELQAALATALPLWQAQATGESRRSPVPVPDGVAPHTEDPGPALEAAVMPVADAGAGRSFYPLIAIDHVLGGAIWDLPGVRSTGQAGEALIPVVIDPERLSDHLDGHRVVYGPAAVLEAIGESLRLTRQGADLLASGQAVAHQDDSPLVPLRDLTGHLLVAGTPLLTQMAIDRHLGTLAALDTRFRLELAAILLDWLTTGDPVKDLAERHNISMNTGYSRLRRARSLVGEQALADAPRRFEITIALHHMVPLWRDQAGT